MLDKLVDELAKARLWTKFQGISGIAKRERHNESLVNGIFLSVLKKCFKVFP
jgi:hypothetical protein